MDGVPGLHALRLRPSFLGDMVAVGGRLLLGWEPLNRLVSNLLHSRMGFPDCMRYDWGCWGIVLGWGFGKREGLEGEERRGGGERVGVLSWVLDSWGFGIGDVCLWERGGKDLVDWVEGWEGSG